jgi:hypothetical protein
MLEKCEHDAKNFHVVHEMHECCKRWLEELLQILQVNRLLVAKLAAMVAELKAEEVKRII